MYKIDFISFTSFSVIKEGMTMTLYSSQFGLKAAKDWLTKYVHVKMDLMIITIPNKNKDLALKNTVNNSNKIFFVQYNH